MNFKFLIHPKIFDNIPLERKKQIKIALKELENPLPEGNKSKIEGYKEEIYRLRIGSYWVVDRGGRENSDALASGSSRSIEI